MENSQRNVVRRDTPLLGQDQPPLGYDQPRREASLSSGSVQSAEMETVLERLRRLEAKFADDVERGRGNPRPDLDPPYGMPPAWKSPTWVPGGPSTGGSSVGPTPPSGAPPPPHMHTLPETRAAGGTLPNLGFRPTHVNSGPQHSTWEIGPPRSTWDPLVLRTSSPYSGSDPARSFKIEAPIFDGLEANNWATRVPYYFDHIQLPEEHRLHYVVMLFAPSVTDWIFSYRANNPTVSWRQFLDAVRRRFDPHYFVNYVELISKLTQTGALSDYNREFERMMNQIYGVSESTLLAMYLSGLRPYLKNHVRYQHPSSVASAMALAAEFDVVSDRGGTSASSMAN